MVLRALVTMDWNGVTNGYREVASGLCNWLYSSSSRLVCISMVGYGEELMFSDVVVSTENDVFTWTKKAGDLYHVTGRLSSGKRFKRMVFVNFYHARAFNVWNGTLWLVRNGKRKRVMRWFN